jgi:hypothetical protein
MASTEGNGTVNDSATPSKFQYVLLDHDKDAIRTIRVVPAHTGPMQCTVHHTTIYERDYTCLSYEWGLEGGKGGYILMDGKLQYVRQNLLDFLERAQRDMLN